MIKKDIDAAEAQRRRFEAAARAVGADESSDSLDRAMGKLNLRTKLTPALEPKKPQDK